MYFVRTSKAKMICIAIGILFTVLTVIFYWISDFDELIRYGYANRTMRIIDTIVFFIFAVLSFGASIILHIIEKDAHDELDSIAKRISREIENSQRNSNDQ